MNENEYLLNSRSNFRTIVVNGLQTTKHVSNSISTTKYSWLTFMPLFLYEQFHNYTNCFFLLVSLIQQFPEAASLGRFTTLLPLCIILIVSALKEIIEDVNRHRGDRKVNRRSVDVLRDAVRWSPTEWRHLQVGDVVRVRSDDFFPADLLLLGSSAENGVCYIETVNLDGENNLKIRRRVPRVNFDLANADQAASDRSRSLFGGIVECDQPNEKIYSFKGVFRTVDDVVVALSPDNILLRGAALRNTQWIVGLVIYTGSETKIMKNSSHTRLKRSSVSVMVNTHIVCMFVLFLCFTLFHWSLFLVWNNSHYFEMWYAPLMKQNLNDPSTLILILVFGVVYAIMIPISLQVMQELSRLIQGMYISNDLDMYFESRDTPAMVKTSALNEDLALVKYIFADKTGTLTKNVLEFKCCSVDGVVYDLNKVGSLGAAGKMNDENAALSHFFVAVSVCPGVIPVMNGDSISYYASSPDQKALVLAAQKFDCTLLTRTHDKVQLQAGGKLRTYEVLCDFEFSSDRKRTSVIVRNSASGQILLYVIGADDVILSRCNQMHDKTKITRQHSETFASEGLRSLFVAMRKIEPADFDAWYPNYKKAYEALSSKEELLEKAESEVLKNLTLLGCSAVEDKLQDDVPETIESLQQAGINMWVLTGDKQETAINIGYACRLLSKQLPLIVLNSNDLHKLRSIVIRHKRSMGSTFGQPGHNYALLVTGDCLNALLDSRNDVDNFIRLMLSCRSVICCRTTPKQKALVVRSVQKYTKFVTLAIGDGANDVAMIQTASIGVGISGMEGMQAANAADYAIGQFKYLKKLLLVHGSWSYNRVCKMIYFIYYKNVAIVTIELYYTAFNGWSGQAFLDRWAKAMYNVMLTSAPTLALGIFEQNLSAQALLNNPYMYTTNNWFNLKSFIVCLLNGIAHSVLLLWLALSVFDSSCFWSSGRNDNYMVVGNIVYGCLILIICFKCALHTYHWTNLTVASMALSQIGWIVVLAALSHTWPWIYVGEDMPCIMEIIFQSPVYWLFMLFVIPTVLFTDLIVVTLHRLFRHPVTESFRNLSLRNGSRTPILT